MQRRSLSDASSVASATIGGCLTDIIWSLATESCYLIQSNNCLVSCVLSSPCKCGMMECGEKRQAEGPIDTVG